MPQQQQQQQLLLPLQQGRGACSCEQWSHRPWGIGASSSYCDDSVMRRLLMYCSCVRVCLRTCPCGCHCMRFTRAAFLAESWCGCRLCRDAGQPSAPDAMGRTHDTSTAHAHRVGWEGSCLIASAAPSAARAWTRLAACVRLCIRVIAVASRFLCVCVCVCVCVCPRFARDRCSMRVVCVLSCPVLQGQSGRGVRRVLRCTLSPPRQPCCT
jgi:hypothetical protein